jgi:hypothetical protein
MAAIYAGIAEKMAPPAAVKAQLSEMIDARTTVRQVSSLENNFRELNGVSNCHSAEAHECESFLSLSTVWKTLWKPALPRAPQTPD